MDFQNRTVLITGAAGQLGRAVVSRFAAAGAKLVLLDRQVEQIKAAPGQSARCMVAAVDLLRADAVQAVLRSAIERFGRIDVLCHLAGGFRMGQAVHETGPDTWDFLFDLNVRTLVNVANAVVPAFIDNGGGRIVTVGAYSAQRGIAQMGAYCASKSALIRLTESMSAELKDRQINVNCVLPTIIDTPDNRTAMPDADPARWVAPEALADVIAFLASDAARAIHGAAVPVSGLS
jgi:NAD(P)-dependent dehydrogenase (short-subunit alcohol dehydrogenase family)